MFFSPYVGDFHAAVQRGGIAPKPHRRHTVPSQGGTSPIYGYNHYNKKQTFCKDPFLILVKFI
jgi:hypothetical protein